jgi:hypothetical protein
MELNTIEIRAASEDISRFVNTQLQRSGDLFKLIERRPKLVGEISDTLIKKFDGMYALLLGSSVTTLLTTYSGFYWQSSIQLCCSGKLLLAPSKKYYRTCQRVYLRRTVPLWNVSKTRSHHLWN